MLTRLFYCSVMLAVPSMASAEKIAVACSGSSTWSDTITGQLLEKTRPLPQQFYVIDTDAKRVTHALVSMQEFEDVCDVTKTDCKVTISQGLIDVTGHEPGKGVTTNNTLKIDRKTGVAVRDLGMEYDNGRYHRSHWDMTCERAQMPVFDKAKNKF